MLQRTLDILTLFLAAGIAFGQASIQPALPGSGAQVTVELKGGQHHDYPVRLQVGELLYVVAEQLGVDVVLRLVNSDGSVVIERDQVGDNPGDLDRLIAIVKESGEYRLRVDAFKKDASPGKYRLSATVRMATRIDSLRAELDEQSARAHSGLQPAYAKLSLEQSRALLRSCDEIGSERDEIDNSIRSTALRTIADAHRYLGERPQAIEYYERTIRFAEEIGHWRGQAGTLAALGSYRALEKDGLPLALELFKHARAVHVAHDNRLGVVGLLLLIGKDVLMAQGKNEDALPLFWEALALTQPAESTTLVTVLNGLGLAKLRTKHYEAAAGHLDRALAIAQGDKKLRSFEALVLNSLGLPFTRIRPLDKCDDFIHTGE